MAHIADMMNERCYIERDPLAVMGVELGNYRTVLAVPMLKDETLKLFPADLNRWDSQRVMDERVFGLILLFGVGDAKVLFW